MRSQDLSPRNSTSLCQVRLTSVSIVTQTSALSYVDLVHQQEDQVRLYLSEVVSSSVNVMWDASCDQDRENGRQGSPGSSRINSRPEGTYERTSPALRSGPYPFATTENLVGISYTDFIFPREGNAGRYCTFKNRAPYVSHSPHVMTRNRDRQSYLMVGASWWKHC